MMKTLTKNNKSGKLALEELPIPKVTDNAILVKNFYSAVSVGTELSSIDIAKQNLLMKAKARPNEFKKVLNLVKNEGFFSAYAKVMNRLDLPAPLGYSSVGQVIDCGKDVTEFKRSDIVACGGCGHSEIISVPKNLCVKIPKGVDFEEASMVTIASIALQGVRQSNCKVGENIAVIGLGLIGQITMKLL